MWLECLFLFNPGFIAIYWVLLGLRDVYLGLSGFTGFTWVLLGFTGFSRSFIGYSSSVLGFFSPLITLGSLLGWDWGFPGFERVLLRYSISFTCFSTSYCVYSRFCTDFKENLTGPLFGAFLLIWLSFLGLDWVGLDWIGFPYDWMGCTGFSMRYTSFNDWVIGFHQSFHRFDSILLAFILVFRWSRLSVGREAKLVGSLPSCTGFFLHEFSLIEWVSLDWIWIFRGHYWVSIGFNPFDKNLQVLTVSSGYAVTLKELTGVIGFDQVLLGLTRFYRDFPRFYKVLSVLLGFTGFYWVFTKIYLGLLGFTEFYWFFPSFTVFYLVLSGFNGFYQVYLGFYLVLLSLTGFYRVWPGFMGFYCCYLVL